jgi:hypothetical protein
MSKLRKHTDFAVVARAFYRNIPDSELKRSCERHSVPLFFAGAGDVMSMYSFTMYRVLQYLRILPFDKVLVADYVDTLVMDNTNEFYDRLPDDGMLMSTDYQKVPYLQITEERPIHPWSLPEFVDCFRDKSTGRVCSPNCGAYGGNRLVVIDALDRMMQYVEHFSMAEELGYTDDMFPYIATIQRGLNADTLRDDQHLGNLLFYDKWRHDQAGVEFPVKIALDCSKSIFTSCQPNFPDGDAIFYHFPGGFNTDFSKQKVNELYNGKPHRQKIVKSTETN